MGKHFINAIALVGIVGLTGENLCLAADGTVTLYQIGKNGKYCVSLSASESDCISGVDDGGLPKNVVDILKGKKVVFENLSDAVHDMKFSGANAENLPPQDPNGAPAQKQMNSEDMVKQMITCSFHGNQLGVGYRVPDAAQGAVPGGGHPPRPSGEGAMAQGGSTGGAGIGGSAGAGGGGTGGDASGLDYSPQKIVRTGLADVSAEVIAKGRPDEVERMIRARPELADKLKAERPLLAQELAAKGALKLDAKAAAGSAAGGSNSPTGYRGSGAGNSAAGMPGNRTAANAVGAVGSSISGGLDALSERLSGGRHTASISDAHVGASARSVDGHLTTASLGMSGPDRTRMKVISQDWDGTSSAMDWRRWPIGLLGASALGGGYLVFSAIGFKKNRKRSRANSRGGR